ncbi:MAG: BamA/TamA family outer membrane protein, partial [Akkermansiaceae bacterium]|nr:BamA/TamA family outer membrane protein [Akkermansiaceae bacterium]
GYLNSGAVIPDQDLADGVLRVAIVEGKLTETILRQRRGDGAGSALAESYLRDRVAGKPAEPLHFPTLQRRLQLLQTNPNILRVNAELQPGALPGEAMLVMDVTEPAGPRWRYGLDCHNQRPPSVGGEQAEVWLETANLTGFSDPLSLRLGLFTGDRGEPEFDPGQTASLRYARPLTAGDTTLELVASRQDYAVVDRVFVPLAIEGENWMAGAALRHPLVRSIRETREPAADRFAWLRPWACCEGDGKSAGEMLARTVHDEVWLSLGLEFSDSTTELLGRPFSISPGYVNGELDLAVLRLGQEWTRRTNDSVLALRSVGSAGLQGLGATRSPVEPDAEFFSWRLHGQYSARVTDSGDMLRLRAGAQWADDALPPPEQWLLGGLHTVRGYRENMLVRDMGCFASIEYSLVLPTGDSGWRLALVPFIDWGLGWDRERSDTTALCAPGLGLRAEYGDWFRGELFWGYALNHREWLAGDDAQDHGVHFLLTIARF